MLLNVNFLSLNFINDLYIFHYFLCTAEISLEVVRSNLNTALAVFLARGKIRDGNGISFCSITTRFRFLLFVTILNTIYNHKNNIFNVKRQNGKSCKKWFDIYFSILK